MTAQRQRPRIRCCACRPGFIPQTGQIATGSVPDREASEDAVVSALSQLGGTKIAQRESALPSKAGDTDPSEPNQEAQMVSAKESNRTLLTKNNDRAFGKLIFVGRARPSVSKSPHYSTPSC